RHDDGGDGCEGTSSSSSGASPVEPTFPSPASVTPPEPRGFERRRDVAVKALVCPRRRGPSPRDCTWRAKSDSSSIVRLDPDLASVISALISPRLPAAKVDGLEQWWGPSTPGSNQPSQRARERGAPRALLSWWAG